MSALQQLFKSARNRPVVDLKTGEYRFLRFAMWVAVRVPGEASRIGIISKPLDAVLFENSSVTVDIVGPDGTTVNRGVEVPAVFVRQAAVDEIPAPRRPDKRMATSLGYSRRGS